MPSVKQLNVTDPFQESVYNLVPKPVQVVVKPPRHKSVYADQAKGEYKKVNPRVGVIGPAHVPRDDPQKFLKKHTGEQKVQVSPPSPVTKKASKFPKQLWEPTKEKVTPIKFEPKQKPAAKPAMVYREKKDYGRAPEYLVQVKQEIQEKKHKQILAEQAKGQPKDFIVLPEEERLRILDGLQKTWEKLNTEYQKLPLMIDTLPKITRKVGLDKQLKKVEEDIEKFSHKNIIIKLN